MIKKVYIFYIKIKNWNILNDTTGILYYQSFLNNVNDINNCCNVKNFVIYNNEFKASNDSKISISAKSEAIKDQFFMYGSKYDNNALVLLDTNNLILLDSVEAYVVAVLNNAHNQVSVLLIPAQGETIKLDLLMDSIINELKAMYNKNEIAMVMDIMTK